RRGRGDRENLLIRLLRPSGITASKRFRAHRARDINQNDPIGIPLLQSVHRRQLLARIDHVRIDMKDGDVEHPPHKGDRHWASIIAPRRYSSAWYGLRSGNLMRELKTRAEISAWLNQELHKHKGCEEA